MIISSFYMIISSFRQIKIQDRDVDHHRFGLSIGDYFLDLIKIFDNNT